MSDLTCKTCGKEFNLEYYTTHDLSVRTLNCNYDGTSLIHHRDSGTFCSAECMMRYLAEQTGLTAAFQRHDTAAREMRALLMILVDDFAKVTDSDTAQRVRRMEKERSQELKAAWLEVERILGEEVSHA
jgi:hypothetical protein